MLCRPLPRLFCLVDATDDLSLLPALAAAGVDGFQVRAKDLGDRALLDLTVRVREAVAAHDAVLVVDDRVDIALAAGAHGVHLGAADLPVEVARRLAPGLVIGATCRSRADVEAARAAGADYAGLGPLRATTSKAGLPSPLGLAAVEQAAGVLPLVAIGGVDAPTARAARDSGAHAVAVIGSIWRQPDPLSAARELVASVA